MVVVTTGLPIMCAYALLSRILNEVEYEFTQVPYESAKWQTDGRLYRPQKDSKPSVPGRPSLIRYRNSSHNTFSSDADAIRIGTLDGSCAFSKLGSNGQAVE